MYKCFTFRHMLLTCLLYISSFIDKLVHDYLFTVGLSSSRIAMLWRQGSLNTMETISHTFEDL